ncbi:hypothetical protein [Aggregatibacter actinomycetemcomitans]|nr:hypothetical protein [Aggregatibacter actinomycetemcomitans]
MHDSGMIQSMIFHVMRDYQAYQTQKVRWKFPQNPPHFGLNY